MAKPKMFFTQMANKEKHLPPNVAGLEIASGHGAP
jgi:hypothetical protein